MNPRTEKQLKKVREKSRRSIMDAAIELFAVNGYHTTSIDKIAKKAKISKGLIYNYFKSKDDLLEAVIFDKAGEFSVGLVEMEKIKDPGKKLQKLIELYFDDSIKEAAYMRFYWSMILHPKMPKKINEKLLNFMEGYIAQMEVMLKNNNIPNPKIEAYLLASSMDASSMMYSYAGERYPMEAIKQQLINKYCKKEG
ncbi:MAG: TetR/AcrR family transcriptional regulator [Fibrobacteria bacterium]|nr:TetR/AcrR family transcriptional regulator [Fibrobacteria bacterium]